MRGKPRDIESFWNKIEETESEELCKENFEKIEEKYELEKINKKRNRMAG